MNRRDRLIANALVHIVCLPCFRQFVGHSGDECLVID